MRTAASTVLSDQQTPVSRKKGGWITLPFLAGSVVGVGMAMSATSSNLIVYLIRKYNVKSIDAAQISNIVRGCVQLAPVLGAAASDAYFGCYPVVAAGAAISLLSFVVFTLTAAFPSLRAPACAAASSPSSSCQPASAVQAAVLYSAVCLLAVGNGGTRYNAATLGADQFAGGGERGRDAFFSWYFACLYASYVAGDTALVYLQDSVSWALGFGVCAATTALGLVALLAGSRYYRRPVPKGSPFTALARVVVAAARKATLSSSSLARVQYYHHGSGCDTDGPTQTQDHVPSERFRFLNRAAMVAEGDDVSVGNAKPWRVCTVREVEDLKSLLRVVPLWSSGILVSTTVNAQVSLTVLQPLTMDRALGPRGLAVPAASITVTVLAAFVLTAALFDRLAAPLWGRLIAPARRHRARTERRKHGRRRARRAAADPRRPRPRPRRRRRR
ncbi:unnamed protein product [Urochloa decumbens]|uniref:Uncharacterized protein n=1 Tax=Urochloa decumbens TaxID=240449 RepID=A0ABC8YNF5_9POAL